MLGPGFKGSSFMAMRNTETNQANELLKYLHPLTTYLVNPSLLMSGLYEEVSSLQWDRTHMKGPGQENKIKLKL